METLTSILVVLDRSSGDAPLLAKAELLARQCDARIELFSCAAETEYALRHSYDARGIEAARQISVRAMLSHLQTFSDRFVEQNLPVAIDAVCESPLYEGILHKVLASRPDLVMKSAAGESSEGRSALDPNDWELVRTCPAPLLLSLGRRWPSKPRFAAVVDVSERETPGLATLILRTAEHLSRGCGGGIEVLFDERAGADERARQAHGATLRRLAEDLHLDARRIRTLIGDNPTASLAACAAEQRYDALVLGALTHKRALTSLIGTVTGELLNALHCDFVLVKSSSFVSPVHATNRGG
jgi:universal stress protein E